MLIIELKDDGLILLDIKSSGIHQTIKNVETIPFKTSFKDALNDVHQLRALTSSIQRFSSAKTAILTISQNTLIYRDIFAPKTNPKYLTSLARHELTHALNLSSDYIIDYALLPQTSPENANKILIAGIQTPALHEIVEFFKRCDVRIMRVDSALNNLMHYLNAYHVERKTKTVLALEFSDQGLRQYFFKRGQFAYQRTNRLALSILDEDAQIKQLLDHVDKMHHFILAQAQGTKLDEVIVFGNHPKQAQLLSAITSELQLSASSIEIPSGFKDKQKLFDNAHIYAYGALAKPKRIKAIDFALSYNATYQKRDYLSHSKRWFNPILVLSIYFAVTTVIILSIQLKQTTDEIDQLNNYLNQASVVNKMLEINTMQAETSKLNEINAEIILIENVLTQYPKLSQALLNALYVNRPANISFSEIRYQDLVLEVDMNTDDVQLIYQYVAILKAQDSFKSVVYSKYEQDTQSGRYNTSLTLQLKEVK